MRKALKGFFPACDQMTPAGRITHFMNSFENCFTVVIFGPFIMMNFDVA